MIAVPNGNENHSFRIPVHADRRLAERFLNIFNILNVVRFQPAIDILIEIFQCQVTGPADKVFYL